MDDWSNVEVITPAYVSEITSRLQAIFGYPDAARRAYEAHRQWSQSGGRMDEDALRWAAFRQGVQNLQDRNSVLNGFSGG